MATTAKRAQRQQLAAAEGHDADPEIPEALWREAIERSWVPTGRRELRRYEADMVGRRLRLAERLDAVLEDEERRAGPLPWPFQRLRGAIRRWARADRALAAKCEQRWQGTERGRGRESRLMAFVKYLLERHPELPRTPGPWIRACDRYGSPEPEWTPVEERKFSPAQERAEWDRRRRARWKVLLRRARGEHTRPAR